MPGIVVVMSRTPRGSTGDRLRRKIWNPYWLYRGVRSQGYLTVSRRPSNICIEESVSFASSPSWQSSVVRELRRSIFHVIFAVEVIVAPSV